jgi:hypothetical protein
MEWISGGNCQVGLFWRWDRTDSVQTTSGKTATDEPAREPRATQGQRLDLSERQRRWGQPSVVG